MNFNIEKVICFCFTVIILTVIGGIIHEDYRSYLLKKQANEVIKEAITRDYSSDHIKGLLNYKKSE